MIKPRYPKSGHSLALVAAILIAGSALPRNGHAKVDGDWIVLGSVLSFTGKYSTKGVSASNGYNLAIKKINDAGGVEVGGKTYRFKIKYYDDGSAPENTARLIERLIRVDGIKFLLGPFGSAATRAALPVTEKHEIPMVQSQGASYSLFTSGHKYAYAVLSTSRHYLTGVIGLAAAVAKKNNRKPQDLRIALIFENDPFSLSVRSGVVDEASKLGMKIVISELMPPDLSDISVALSKVKALRPDVLLISGHAKGAETAARQIGMLKIDVPMIAMTDCETADITAKYGAAADGILCPIQWTDSLRYKDPLFGTAATYGKLFKSTFKGYRETPFQAAQASAAVLVWKDALERANGFDVEVVRTALAATDLSTFYGRIKFSPAGANTAKPMALRQIQDGTYRVVAPMGRAPHEVRWPRKVSGL